jgi:hypothetical protein
LSRTTWRSAVASGRAACRPRRRPATSMTATRHTSTTGISTWRASCERALPLQRAGAVGWQSGSCWRRSPTPSSGRAPRSRSPHRAGKATTCPQLQAPVSPCGAQRALGRSPHPLTISSPGRARARLGRRPPRAGSESCRARRVGAPPRQTPSGARPRRGASEGSPPEPWVGRTRRAATRVPEK